jgi:hypothetical protein
LSCFVFVFVFCFLVKEGGDGCLFICFISLVKGEGWLFVCLVFVFLFGKGGVMVVCVSCFFLDLLFVVLLHLYSSSHSFIFAFISLLVINKIP